MSLARFFRRGRWDDERMHELESYLAIETDENIARGMTDVDARAPARRNLATRPLLPEEIFQMNTIQWFDSLGRDLKYGARLPRLNPGFTAVAILSLALGVGANTAIFQLLDAVRIRTLPVQDPQQLVDVRIEDNGRGRTGRFSGRAPMFTYPLYEQIRDRQEAFSSLAVWGTSTPNLTTSGTARLAAGLWVNGEVFDA